MCQLSDQLESISNTPGRGGRRGREGGGGRRRGGSALKEPAGARPLAAPGQRALGDGQLLEDAVPAVHEKKHPTLVSSFICNQGCVSQQDRRGGSKGGIASHPPPPWLTHLRLAGSATLEPKLLKWPASALMAEYVLLGGGEREEGAKRVRGQRGNGRRTREGLSRPAASAA